MKKGGNGSLFWIEILICHNLQFYSPLWLDKNVNRRLQEVLDWTFSRAQYLWKAFGIDAIQVN